MALQLILGNSGAGKSHYMFEKMISGAYQGGAWTAVFCHCSGAVHYADPEGSGRDASAPWHYEH